MADITVLPEFSRDGDKRNDGLTELNGFPQALKPARQWMNFILNKITVKMNEVITKVNTNTSGLSQEIEARESATEDLENRIDGLSFVLPGATFLWCVSAVPDGYLELAGQAISRTTYSALFALFGTTYGAGDGSTTFNLPDLRGEFVRGWDHGRGIDAGRTLGSAQAATSVFMGDPSVTAGRVANLYNTADNNQQTMTNALNGEATTIDSTNLVVLSNAAEVQDPVTAVQTTMSVRPRNIALMYIIKT